MYIKRLEIKSFGPFIDKTVELDRGLNVIEGKNESGKSTVAMFIKFMLYGLSGKASGGDSVSEREHYINWDTGIAAGAMLAECGGTDYKIERRLTKSEDLSGRDAYHESVRVTDLSTGDSIKNVRTPGEYFFGFPEKVFMHSAFVKNLDTAKVNDADLKTALENLLTAGDEEINTKKALEKLDSARKFLLHKNGVGGKLAELSCEKRELDEMLKESKDVSNEIVSLEGTLADTEVKAARREKEFAEYSALCRAYEAVRIGARVKEIERCEGSIKFLRSELDGLNPEIDRSLLAKIEQCDGNVREIERDLQILSEKRAALEEKCEGRELEEPPDEAEVMKKASRLKMGRVFSLVLSCTLCALAAVLGASFLIFGDAAKGLYGVYFLPLVIVSAVFFACGVGGFFLYRSLDKKWSAFLEKWGADDIYVLENTIVAKKEKYKYTKKLLDSINSIDETTERAVEKHDREIDSGFALGRMLGIEDSDNVFDTLEKAKAAAEEICSRRDTMTVKLESVKGRLSALLEEVSQSERESAEAAEREALEDLDRDKILDMTKEDYARAQRERDFAESSARSLRQRESEIKIRLSALSAAGKSPAEIAGRISELEKDIEKLTFRHRALVTAYAALERAGEKMRGDVMPHVAQEAAAMMGRITGGKYETLSAGDNLELSFISDNEKRSVEYLSEGTRDAAYISVRAALVKIMYKDSAPAMVFDECFARMDRERLSGVMRVLSGENTPQSLVFTCRTLESAAAPEANVIRL